MSDRQVPLCWSLYQADAVLLVDLCTSLSVQSKYVKRFKLPAENVLGIALDVLVYLGKIGTFVVWKHHRMRWLSVYSKQCLPGSLFESWIFHREAWNIPVPLISRYPQFCYDDKWCLVYILLYFLVGDCQPCEQVPGLSPTSTALGASSKIYFSCLRILWAKRVFLWQIF